MIDGMEDPWEGLSERFVLVLDPESQEYMHAGKTVDIPQTAGGTFVRVIRISYRKDWTKGEAWDHIQANPPTVQTPLGPMKPHYPMLASGRMGHPFRKDHDEHDWGWTIRTWVRGTAKPSTPKPRHPNTRPRPVKVPPVSRMDLISGDDWDPRDPRCTEEL